VLPLPQRCPLPAHEESTLPLSSSPSLWLLPLQLPSPSPLPLPTLLLLPLPLPIPVTIAISHCHCGCCQPLLPPSLLHRRQPLPLPSPLLSAISISVTMGHHSFHLHWPSPLLLPLAISKSCCLGAARIVFKQFKQRILTLFNFVRTVGSALIKAG
jgi:hypothetical protein